MENKRDLIEKRINSGLLGQWYPVCKSVQVRKEPHGIKVVNRKLVLWRNVSGEVQCVEDFCPHRGAPLSLGEVHHGYIACKYHGVMLNGKGVIKEVPAMPQCSLEGKAALKAYQTEECNGAIFVYIPSLERPDTPSLLKPEEFLNEEWQSFLCTAVWNTNYRYALDNLADPMHGSYLHSESFTLAYGSKRDLMEIEKQADGFIVKRTGQLGDNFDWSYFHIGEANMYCSLDIPYPPAAGPGGVMRIIGYATPIDETTCKVFFWRMRKVSGLNAESWRFLYRAKLEKNHWNVLEQDRVMLEGMPDDARNHEMLYQHDIGVSRIRQVLLKSAKSQIDVELASKPQVETISCVS